MSSYHELSMDLNRVCSLMEQNELEKCENIRKTLIPLEADSISSEDLLTSFKLLIARMHQASESICLKPVSEIAFCIMRVLLDRKDIPSVARLLEFARNDLFMFYLGSRELYYACVNAFYKEVTGKYPEELPRRGYKDIRNVSSNKPDNGFMEIDYIHITHMCAAFLYKLKEAANQIDDEAILAKDISHKSNVFSSFADLGYGLKEFNRKKESQLYKDCLKTPKGFDRQSEKELLRAPVWIALAYATAEASGMYYGRYNVASSFGFGDMCPAATSLELSVIDDMKQHRKKQRVILVIVVVLIVAAAALLKFYTAGAITLGFAVIAVATILMTNKGKGPEIWYWGHHYIGPAYWIKRD